MILGAPRRDSRGRLVISARLARTGWQSYSTGDEYRDAAEVFAPASLATFVGAPVYVGHVAEDTRRTAESKAVGYVRSVQRDGEHVLGEVVLFDAATIADVEAGKLREWSMGYDVELDGDRQKNIRIKHAAILPPGHARCGSSCSVVP